MKLSTTFRIALLSVSLAALGAAVPLTPGVSAQGFTLGGAAFADEIGDDTTGFAEDEFEPDYGDDEGWSDCCDPSPGELAEADFDYEGAVADDVSETAVDDAGDAPDPSARSAQPRETRGADDNRDGDEMGVGTSFGRKDGNDG